MKTNKKLALLIGVSFISLAPMFANAQIAPLPGFPQERYTEFKADKDVIYGTLPNGMRYAIQKWPTPKNEVAIRLRIAGGSLNEKENQRGLMHFLEHMAFNGSENVKEDEFDKILSREGLAFGPDSNAYTSFDEVVYQLDMPKAEKLELGLKMMRETAGRLTLAEDAIDRERGIIESEERTRENPSFKSFRAYMHATFEGLRFTQRLPIGLMDVVKTAKRERFQELYKDIYNPSRAFLVLVGDIDTASAEKLIKQEFENWEAVKTSDDPDLGKLKQDPGKITIYKEALLPVSINLTQPRDFKNYPDNTATKLKFLHQSIAFSILNNRLDTIGKKETSPYISAAAFNSGMAKSVNYAAISATAKDFSKWKDSLEVIDTELRKALEYGFTDDEMKEALANIEQGYVQAVAQKGARRSAGIASSILSEFGNDSVLISAEDNLAWYKANAAKINKNDALKELKEAWGTSLPKLFINTTNDLKEQEVKSAWEAIRKIKPAAPELQKAKAWDYTNFGAVNYNHSRTDVKDLGVSYIKFSNNVNLVVKPTEFEKGRIRISVNYGEGELGLTSQPLDNAVGTGLILSSSYTAGGLGKLTTDEIQRVLAGKNVGGGFAIGDEAFSFNAVTVPSDLNLQMQYLAAYYTDPAWRKDGFNQIKGAKDAIYRQINSTPASVWGLNSSLVLFENPDPKKVKMPTEAEFEKLDLETAKTAYQNAIKNPAMEIVIIGDTTIADAIKAVGSTFGALPKFADKPDERASERNMKFPSARKTTTLYHEGNKDQALGLVFWPMRDYGDGKEVRKLRILESILQIRLNEVIREKFGGTYSPSTGWSPSTVYKDYGTLSASLVLKPEETDKYLSEIENITAELVEGKIDADLFNRARNPLIANFEETINNNPWWLNWLQGSSFNKTRLIIIRDGKKQYEETTLEEVKALAKQYFNPQKAQIIKVLPKAQ